MSPPASEREPLLQQPPKKPWYRPRPLWLVSCAIISSLCRGMTLASRTEVFVQVACQNYWRNQPHHTGFPTLPESFPQSQPAYPHSFYLLNNDSEHINCANPDVQAGAAKLQTIVTTSMGLLSALSTGWWGRFGDFHGRTKVLAAAQFSVIFTDAMFLMASYPSDGLKRHSQLLLLISPIVEGLLGGLTTVTSATNAYISDCTSHGSRAQIFSRFTGATYIGFALGPEVAALILRRTGETTPVFLTSVALGFFNLIFVLFVMPESLILEVRERNIKVASQQQLTGSETVAKKKGLRHTARRVKKAFMEPLAVFAPVQRQQGRGMDWTLALVAIATLCFQLSAGIFQLKYLYAKHVFAWSAETLSYYITAAGTIRAFHLLLVLPIIIRLTKPAPKSMSITTRSLEVNTEAGAAPASNEAAVGVAGDSASAPNSNPTAKGRIPLTPLAILSEIKFDLWVARISLFLDFLSHTLVTIAPSPSAPLFVGFSLVNSLGTGLVPALHSVAMCTLYLRERNGINTPDEESGKGGKDVGKLFGSLAILQAVGMSILGPMIFGLVYSNTVATFPKAIFILAAGLIVIAIVVLCLIRPPRVDLPIQIRVETHVRTSIERLRGRSRGRKDITEGLTSGFDGLNY